MKTFYYLVANTLLSSLTTTLVWFGLGIWIYLETRSVVATSILSGIIMIAWATTGVPFGALVDKHKKKTMMLISSLASLLFFIVGFILYLVIPYEEFKNPASLYLWLLVIVLFIGVIIGNIRMIALPTTTTILVEEEKRDKANGLVGMVNGVAFLISPILGGFLLAIAGMFWVLVLSIVLLIVTIIHLLTISVPEKEIVHHSEEDRPKSFDFRGTLKIIQTVPGLLGLIIFNLFNNFLGGVFMPLMDPYGLSLVPQQVWGVISGLTSIGFVIGGLLITKVGLGKSPLRTLFLANIVMWFATIFFTIQPSIILMIAGFLTYTSIMPFVEASEQTIVQKVVAPSKQGRVFGFSQSVEMAASPLTAFAIGPLTQFFFIPFMTNGKGADLIGGWFGTGEGRGIALVFTVAGMIGLLITIFAMRTKAYRLLTEKYLHPHSSNKEIERKSDQG